MCVGRDALYRVPPELVGLLRSIHQHGSLIHAIREAGISYRHAWGLLGRWEAITGHKLALLTLGQGTGLTPFGKRFAELDAWLKERVGKRLDGLDKELVRYLDISAESTTRRVQMHASSDIALSKPAAVEAYVALLSETFGEAAP